MTGLPTPRRGLAALALAVALACGGGGGGGPVGPPTPTRVLAVGIVRRDLSPYQNLEGYLVFFFDIDEQRLLSARATINGKAVQDSLLPGTVPGPIYARGTGVRSGEQYSLVADVDTPEGNRSVTSSEVTAPDSFGMEVPETQVIGQPMTVTWDPTPDAQRINVAVGSAYETDLPASQHSVTIPASAFVGMPPGGQVEVEVTAFNVFYVSITGGINGLQDAKAFAERFSGVDNVDGAEGVFGAATTVGRMVTLQ